MAIPLSTAIDSVVSPTPAATESSGTSKTPTSDLRWQHLIQIDGDWYDISKFQHPGGAVIQEFVGRDATEVFFAFHVNHAQVLKRVPKTKKLPQLDEPSCGDMDACSISSQVQEADKAFSKDMKAMIDQMRLEGYFEPSKAMLVQKILLSFAFFLAGWTKVFTATRSARNEMDSTLIDWTGLVYAAILIALFLQQCGFLLHDFMHNNWFHKRSIDQAFGRFFGTFCVGLSGLWWRDEHFIHHVFTNTIDQNGKTVKDIQIAEDVWAQHEDLLQFFDGSLSFRQMDALPLWLAEMVIRYQAYLWLPLTVILGRMNIIAASFVKEHRNDERFLQACHVTWFVGLLYAAFPTWQSALVFHFMVSIGQGVLHVQLLVSHYVKPWHDVKNMKVASSWYRNQVESTVNIAPFFSTRCWMTRPAPAPSSSSFSWSSFLDTWDDYYAPYFDDWFHGGLNLHIEHHTNPTLPRNSLRECSRRIQVVCRKHGVRYDERHFFQAVWDTLVQLNNVGKKAKFSEHNKKS